MTATFVIRAAGLVKYAKQLEAKAALIRHRDPAWFERLMDDASTARRQAQDLLDRKSA